MKYLVHKYTKKHIQYTPAAASWGGEFLNIVEADADGWIPWNGGECPLPDCNVCEVETASVERGGSGNRFAINWIWGNHLEFNKIIAYRPILAEKAFTPQPLEVAAENLSDLQNKYFEEWLEERVDEAVGTTVFDSLRNAVEAANTIPIIIARINLLLPDGYCVTKQEESQ